MNWNILVVIDNKWIVSTGEGKRLLSYIIWNNFINLYLKNITIEGISPLLKLLI